MNKLQDFTIVGRLEEITEFNNLLNSPKAELLAMYGRRRVGKTFLIRNYFKKHICYELSGTIDATVDKQLYNFAQQLGFFMQKGIVPATPKHWQEAFVHLSNYLEKLRTPKKKVIFFDELPWLDTLHSGFLAAFEWLGLVASMSFRHVSIAVPWMLWGSRAVRCRRRANSLHMDQASAAKLNSRFSPSATQGSQPARK